jgi:hypothetical protein
LSYF